MDEFYDMHIVKTKALGPPEVFRRYDRGNIPLIFKWRHLCLFYKQQKQSQFRNR